VLESERGLVVGLRQQAVTRVATPSLPDVHIVALGVEMRPRAIPSNLNEFWKLNLKASLEALCVLRATDLMAIR
jgi:hypothetical protein